MHLKLESQNDFPPPRYKGCVAGPGTSSKHGYTVMLTKQLAFETKQSTGGKGDSKKLCIQYLQFFQVSECPDRDGEFIQIIVI